MKSLILIFGLTIISAGLILAKPITVFGQDEPKILKSTPPRFDQKIQPAPKENKKVVSSPQFARSLSQK